MVAAQILFAKPLPFALCQVQASDFPLMVSPLISLTNRITLQGGCGSSATGLLQTRPIPLIFIQQAAPTTCASLLPTVAEMTRFARMYLLNVRHSRADLYSPSRMILRSS